MIIFFLYPEYCLDRRSVGIVERARGGAPSCLLEGPLECASCAGDCRGQWEGPFLAVDERREEIYGLYSSCRPLTALNLPGVIPRELLALFGYSRAPSHGTVDVFLGRCCQQLGSAQPTHFLLPLRASRCLLPKHSPLLGFKLHPIFSHRSSFFQIHVTQGPIQSLTRRMAIYTGANLPHLRGHHGQSLYLQAALRHRLLLALWYLAEDWELYLLL